MWLTRIGASARAYSSWKMTCCATPAARPPYSSGQSRQVQPCAARWRSQATRTSKASCSRPGPPRPLAAAKSPVRWSWSQARISARNASSAAVAGEVHGAYPTNRLLGTVGRVDLSFSAAEDAFRAAARSWLAAHLPAEPLPSMDTAEGFEAHRRWERRAVRGAVFGGVVAGRVRRTRRVDHRVAGLRGGVLGRRRAGAGVAERDQPAGAVDAGPRDRRTEGAVPARDGVRGADLGAGVVGAGGGIGFGVAAFDGGAGAVGRRVAAVGAEDVVFARDVRGLGIRSVPQRPGGRASSRADLLPVPVDRAGDHGPADSAVRRRAGLRRAVLRRGVRPGRGRARRGRRRLEGHDGHRRQGTRAVSALAGTVHGDGRAAGRRCGRRRAGRRSSGTGSRRRGSARGRIGWRRSRRRRGSRTAGRWARRRA